MTGGPRPDFVIIGAQKSGSTALMRLVGDHPEVFLPEHETRFFRDPWYRFEDPSVLVDAVRTDDPRVRRRGIKCPDILADPQAPDRLREHLGEVPLLAVLRDPVARAVSAYFWGVQWGWVPRLPLAEGFDRLLDGTVDPAFPRAYETLDYGRYGEHLTRWTEQAGEQRLRVVLDRDLRDDLPGTVRGIFEFLGVDASFTPPAPGRRVNEGVYSPLRLKLLSHRTPYILREFPGFPGRRYLQPAVGLRGKVVNRGISVLDRVVLARVLDNTRPELPARTRERLAAYYRPDVEVLETLLGRSLAHWGLTPGAASDPR